MASLLEMSEMYDNALFGILQHVGNIQEFLQIFFGFLYRKTDFYRLLSSPNDKMGFPPGVAEKMVLKVKFIVRNFSNITTRRTETFFALLTLLTRKYFQKERFEYLLQRCDPFLDVHVKPRLKARINTIIQN